MRRLLLLALFLALPASALELVGPAGTKTLAAADLAKLPRQKVTMDDHGKPATFEGVELSALLTLAGAPMGEHLRGKELLAYVEVEGADGYRALFALAELDPAFVSRKVILADRRDGKALGEKEAPLRIAVEGEKRMARCVWQVVRISVKAAQ